MEHTHSNDSLYPRSMYLCTECNTVHGTRPVNGAVNWQCFDCCGGSAKQVYIGYRCLCGELIREETNG